MIWVRPDLEPLFAGLDVEGFLALEGRLVKSSARGDRRTLELDRAGRRFFLKTHQPVGWAEVAKNLVSLKLPILGAGPEVRALRELPGLGIATARLAAHGRLGRGPWGQRSFVLTEALEVEVRLSALSPEDLQGPGGWPRRRTLIDELGRMVRALHGAGFVHQDLYVTHVLLGPGEPPPVYLIDLHRVQRRGTWMRRWRVKDLAALASSARALGLTRQDRLRFLAAYRDCPWRDALRDARSLVRAVERWLARGAPR